MEAAKPAFGYAIFPLPSSTGSRRTQLSRGVRVTCSAQKSWQSHTILCVDIGTSLTKAALITADTGDVSGSVVSSGYSLYSESPFHVTQKKNEWYKALISAAADALSSRRSGNIVRAISVTGQMQDLLACGREVPDLLQEDIILYSDARAVAEAHRLSALTGELIQPTSLLAKLALLPIPANTLPKYRFLFGGADFAISRLAEGHTLHLTDPTGLSTTGLSKAPHRAYDKELLARCGLSAFLPHFPIIQESLAVCGYLSAQAAEDLRCPELAGTPLVHAGGDAGTATLGAGCVDVVDKDYLYIGTSGWFGRVSNDRAARRSNSSGLFHLAHPHKPECSLELASLASAGSNFGFAADVLLGGVSLAELNRMALSAPVGAHGVSYVPYLSGRRCPCPDARATGALTGLSGASTPADIARAVVEGVAFGLRLCSEEMRTGIREYDDSTTLPVVGGGARSAALLHAVAGALQRPVSRGVAAEVGLRGAAFAAVVALGKTEQLKNWKRANSLDSSVVLPRPEESTDWERAYQQWESHLRAVEGTWG